MRDELVKRYWSGVLLIKYTVLASFIGVLLIVFGPIVYRNILGSFKGGKVDFVEFQQDGTKSLVVEPSFVGVDQNGRSYTIKAQKAVQSDQQKTEFFKMVFQGLSNEGKSVKVEAEFGILDGESKTISATRGVVLNYAGEYTLGAEKILVHYDTNEASGSGDVKVKGDFGRIEGQEFEISKDRGCVRLFGNGRVHAVIHSKREKR